MPTFCEVIGIKDYEKKYRNKEKEVDYFDGISFAPTLLGKNKQKKHDFLYWEFDETDQIAVRMDDWKMVVKKGTPFLYNLKTDIHEAVSYTHLDVYKRQIFTSPFIRLHYYFLNVLITSQESTHSLSANRNKSLIC